MPVRQSSKDQGPPRCPICRHPSICADKDAKGSKYRLSRDTSTTRYDSVYAYRCNACDNRWKSKKKLPIRS